MKTMCGGLFSFCVLHGIVFGNGQVAITHNVSGLKEVAELTDKMMNGELNFIPAQTLISGTKPAIFLSPCYTLMQFFFSVNSLKNILNIFCAWAILN